MSISDPQRYDSCEDTSGKVVLDGTNGLLFTQDSGCYSLYGAAAPFMVRR